MLTVVLVVCGVFVFSAPVARATPTTHSWTGVDPVNPHDWGKAKNWDDESVPANGDIVVIDGARVTNVPSDKSFADVTIKNGAHLDSGGPLATDRLVAKCAVSDVDIQSMGNLLLPTAIHGLDMTDGTTFTNHGTVDVSLPFVGDDCTSDPFGHKGKLRLFTGAVFRNYGTLTGGGTVLGMVCCTNPQILRNETTGRIDGSSDLTLKSLRLHHKGRMLGGTVTLEGGDHLLTSSSRFSNVVVYAEDAVINANVPGSTTASTITLGANANLGLYQGSELAGYGSWSGPGTLSLRHGFVYGRQTIAEGTRFSVSGPDTKGINKFGGNDPGEVVVFGDMVIGTGALTIGGRVIIRDTGTLTALAGSRAVVTGLTCCAAPVNGISNYGTIVVGSGAVARFAALKLDNHSIVNGAGKLVIDGGTHTFRDKSSVRSRMELKGAADLRLEGTSTVTAALDQTNADVTTPAPGASVVGGGSWTFVAGSLSGEPRFGPNLDFETAGAATKSILAGTSLTVDGPALLGGAGELRFTAGTLGRFNGTTTFVGAEIDAWNCCTSAARVEFHGPVAARKSAGVALIESVEAVFFDTVDVNGGVLEIYGLPAVFANSADMVLKLDGGAFRSTGPVRLPPAATISGPGTVRVDTLRVNGTLRLASRDDLRIAGSMVLGSTAITTLAFSGSRHDRIVVGGAAQLGGRLRLVSVPASGPSTTLLVADDRGGFFDTVTGRPAGRLLSYDSTHVRLG